MMLRHVRKGQGLCPWTPLGPEAPDPHFFEGKAEGGMHVALSETSVCLPPPCLQESPVQGGSPWWGTGGKAPSLVSSAAP
jgi:hypothetical protein